MSLPELPPTATQSTISLDWRCLECDREWSTTAVADVCCPDCGAEGAASVLERPIRGPSA